MSDFFSKERLKNLAISILLLFITNIFTSWIHLRSYAYSDLTNSLTSVILYIDDLKADIFEKQIGYEESEPVNIYRSTDTVMNLQFKERTLSNSLDLDTGDSDWEDIRDVISRINTILASDTVNAQDREYLEIAYTYLDELQVCYETLYKDGSAIEEEDSFFGFNRDKKAYMAFLQKAEELSEEPEYEVLWSDEASESLTGGGYMYSFVDDKRAEKFSEEVFTKITGRKDEVDSIGFEYGRYIFENSPEKRDEDKMYHMEVNAENGDFYMYKRVRFSQAAVAEKKIDEMAADIIERIADETYICYEKIPRYYEEQLEEMEYRFIRKTDEVYNENKMIEISIDRYGQLSSVAISDILKEEADIQPPEISVSDVSEDFSGYDPERIIFVHNKDDGFQYYLYTDFNGDMYTTSINAQTRKIVSVKKSESIYYEEIALK